VVSAPLPPVALKLTLTGSVVDRLPAPSAGVKPAVVTIAGPLLLTRVLVTWLVIPDELSAVTRRR